MVNKHSLTSKLFFVFFTTVLIIFLVLVMLVVQIVEGSAYKETYLRLKSYTAITSNYWENGKILEPSDDFEYKFAIIQGKYELVDDKYIYTITNEVNSSYYFNENEIEKIIYDLTPGTGNLMSELEYRIFYNFELSITSDNFLFIAVNDSYTSNVIQRLSVSIGLILIVLLLIFTFPFMIFLSKLNIRISKLKSHVDTLNINRYEKSYIDNESDEIGDLSRSIEMMRKDIKNNEQTKREMLQNISHDFKTPISVIRSYAEACSDEIIDPREASKTIINQADMLKSKVSQLLQYNRLEYLTKNHPFDKINMKDICYEIASQFKINSRNIEIVTNLDDCLFEGYDENLRTVVENIVDNALRYAKTKIVITTKSQKLTIYNDGEPIDEQFLSANFKPYEKGSKGQFGLGMSIVKKTVDFFNLKLDVYNEEYGGVSFVITSLEKVK